MKPILAYSHAGGRCAITGGYVYRGSDIPALQGLVRVRRLLQRRDLGGVRRRPARTRARSCCATRAHSISSFGENATGELYVVDLGGTIYRIDHG